MFSKSALIALACVIASGSVQAAGGSCSASGPQQYNNLPGFPASKSGCYPTSYYRTSDLGQTNPDDAKTRCQEQCTADDQCNSVVAQLNKAADSNLYSGTCFFYSQTGTPSGPRRCTDTAYLLLGYKKDSTKGCFSSSSVSASSFCSSYLNIPKSTVTATSTPLPVTTTSTATSKPVITTVTTITTTPTTTASATKTVTLTVGTVTATTTVTVSTSSTTTITNTATVTQTVTIAGKKKRAFGSVPPPACVTSDTPATRLSAACSCLSVATATTTTTSTLTPVTATATTTTTIPTTTTVPVTVTAPQVTTTVIGTATSTVYATTTSTATVTSTIPVRITTVTTTTVTTTATAVSTACLTCDEASVVSSDGSKYYNRNKQGCGIVGSSFVVQTSAFWDSSYSDCYSIQRCADFADDNNAPAFQVYISNTDSSWHCDVSGTRYSGGYTANSNVAQYYEYNQS